MNGDTCRCDHLWEGHRRRGTSTELRGKCLAAGCACDNFFGALAPQAPRFPVITRRDPSMVREYGKKEQLIHHPFAELGERLAMEVAMAGSAEVTAEELDEAAAETLEQYAKRTEGQGELAAVLRLPVVAGQGAEESFAVLDEAADWDRYALETNKRLAEALSVPRPIMAAGPPVNVMRGRYPLEDWSAWYCRECRHTGRPEDHTSCPHPLERVRVQVIPDGEDRG